MKPNKQITISILIAGSFILGAFFLNSSSSSWDSSEGLSENVSVVDSTQFVDIKAKGGYSPNITYARSGIPTVLRIETNNTFDCSSSLVIPSIGYRNNLNPSGITEIELPSQDVGTSLRGLCSMGMYGFELRFN